MQTPEYLAAEEKHCSERQATHLHRKGRRNRQVGRERDRSSNEFRPRFYDINNAWIHDEKNRGKGYGKEIYKAFIEQAIEYSKRPIRL